MANKKITITIVISNFYQSDVNHQALFLHALHMMSFIPFNNSQLGPITISILQKKHKGIKKFSQDHKVSESGIEPIFSNLSRHT